MFKLLALFTLLLPFSAFGETFTADGGRTVYVRGTVDGNILLDAARIEKLSQESATPITLVINSPGGAVLPGIQFVSAMRVAQSRGVKFRCFVPVMAASMAMIIYNECDERYALSQGVFLWHSIRVGLYGSYTPDQMKAITTQLLLLQQNFNRLLISALGISEKTYYYYFDNEFWVPGSMLKLLSPRYLTIVDDFEGVEGPFDL